MNVLAFYRKNPDLVLVDTQVIALSPPRLLVAGMGDALATWFEAKTCVDGRVKNMRGGLSTQSALALAKLCYRTLLADGADALRSVQTQVVTPALERLVEANTLLSGIGFESSGLAAAHAIHNGLTTAEATHAYLHGEKVAFGLLAQLVLEGQSRSVLHRVLGFATEVGLPITLAEIGLTDLPKEDLQKIAVRATAEAKPSTMNHLKSSRTWWPMRSWQQMRWDGRGRRTTARQKMTSRLMSASNRPRRNGRRPFGRSSILS